MRNFSKKLAFVLAAAMVFTAFAPAAKADAAEKMTMNRASQTLYVNEGLNDKGAETLPEGLYGNVQTYDFWVKNKPANYAKELNFKWASDNEKVATVDQKGLTTAVAVGTANITCTITDKAAKVDPVVVTAKVTVKANAADVVISNADEYEDFVVADERVIDLNRDMYDEDGNKTNKRGKFVTDYTKWVAKFDGEEVANTVVAVDQATGKFTFAADAPAGEYELSCYTYQSDKYNQVTAESDPVVVTVEEAVELAIEDVTQKTLTKFTVDFTAPVASLSKADVTVKKVLKNGFQVNAQVKSVTLAKDGMSADVVMFGSFADATTYKITVGDLKTFDKLMSAGAPASIKLYVGDDVNGFLVATDEATAINCLLFDANDVDVTTDELKAKVNYTLEKYATDGSYYLSNKKLTIKKENVDVTVKATYRYTANNKVVTVDGYGEFYGYKKEAPVISNFVVTVGDKIEEPTLKFQKSKTPTLKLQVVDTANQKTNMTYADGVATIGSYGTVSFEALNPEYAVLNGTSLKAFQTGFASFLVYVDADGAGTKASPEPVYEFTLEVEADAAYAGADLTTNFVTVSGADEFDTADFTVSAVDQYGQASELTAADVSIEALSDLAKKVNVSDVFSKAASDKKVKITVDGSEAKKAFDPALKAGESGSLDFKIKVKNKDEFTFTVNVQMPGEAAGNYISISAQETINATRKNEDKMKDAKSVTFEVVEMNCEVKVNEVTGLTVLPDENANANTYYYKLLKDGKAVTAAVSGNKISFALTGTKTVSGGAIDGKALVSYENTGAGVYTFELYKGADQIASKTTVVTVDEKDSYNESGDMKAESVKKAYTKADLLACFTISDRKGNDVLKEGATPLYADYDVDVDVANDYVFVKKITFYEKVAEGVYVDYAVEINEVLKLTDK